LVRLAVRVAAVVLGAGTRVVTDAPEEVLRREAAHAATRANLDAFDACAGPHFFQRMPDALATRDRYRCKRCGGVCDAKAYRWYRDGLRHGIALARRNEGAT
jgi:hypothetical protein